MWNCVFIETQISFLLIFQTYLREGGKCQKHVYQHWKSSLKLESIEVSSSLLYYKYKVRLSSAYFVIARSQNLAFACKKDSGKLPCRAISSLVYLLRISTVRGLSVMNPSLSRLVRKKTQTNHITGLQPYQPKTILLSSHSPAFIQYSLWPLGIGSCIKMSQAWLDFKGS